MVYHVNNRLYSMNAHDKLQILGRLQLALRIM